MVHVLLDSGCRCVGNCVVFTVEIIISRSQFYTLKGKNKNCYIFGRVLHEIANGKYIPQCLTSTISRYSVNIILTICLCFTLE